MHLVIISNAYNIVIEVCIDEIIYSGHGRLSISEMYTHTPLLPDVPVDM